MRPKFYRHPAIPFIEARESFDSAACYRPHTHPTLSLGIVDAGTSVLTLPDRKIPLRVGDIVVIDAHVVHACNPPAGSPWSYRMLYFDVSWLGAEVTGPWKTPQRSAESRCVFERLWRRIVEETFPSTGAIRMDVRQLLRRARDDKAVVANQATDRLQPILRYIAENCDVPLRLRALARQFGFSEYQLIRMFRAQIGMTPHAYQVDQRVVRARELLKARTPAADVACRLGFSDQSHLIRAFKPRVAATPRQFAQVAGAKSSNLPRRTQGKVAACLPTLPK